MDCTQTNRTKQFVRNVIGSAVLQIVTIITGFISPKIMLNAFGSEINGITSSITQFVSYIALVESGLSNATVFALYKPLADKDKNAIDSIVAAAKISYYKIGTVFVGLSVMLACIYPFIGKTDALSLLELGILVLVLCANPAINFFVLAKYRALLTADQCGYLISIASSIQLLVHLAIIYFGVKAGFGVVVVRALGLCSVLLTSVILSIMVRMKYVRINFKATPDMKALDKRWDAMSIQIMGVITTGAPVIIMTALLDYKQISVYSIYNMIVGSISTCLTVFTSGLGAAFGNIYAVGDDQLLKKTTEEFRTAFIVIITILYAVLGATLLQFVKIYTLGISDVNYFIPVFSVLITIRGLVFNYRTPHGMLIYSFGKFRVIRNPTLVYMLITVCLAFLFTKIWGLNGNIIALCIAELYMLFVHLLISPKELIIIPIWKNVRQIIQSLILVGLIFFASHMAGIFPNSYGGWFVYACIIGIITCVVTISSFAVSDHQDVISLWRRICGFIKK